VVRKSKCDHSRSCTRPARTLARRKATEGDFRCTRPSGHIGASELADALLEHESDLREILGGIDGFQAYYLVKLAEGTATVSVFDSKEGADASTAAAAAWLAENMLDMAATPYVTAGDVVLNF
jgi:hypothetical protein